MCSKTDMGSGFIFALLLAGVGCSSAKPAQSPSDARDAGGDGSTCATAVKIHAADERSGVKAEYAWLKEHYPGAKTTGQALTTCEKRPTDVLTIKTDTGQEKELYFDISDFFGKL